MLAVSALTFALGTLAVVLPGAGGSAATGAGPPAALATGSRRALAIPARELQPPARLHRRNQRRHLRRSPTPAAAASTRTSSTSTSTSTARSRGTTTRSTARPWTRSTIGARTRSATCRQAPPSASGPTSTGTSRFNRRHHHSLMGKPFSRRFPNEYWLNLKNGRGQRDFVLRRVEARTRKCARAGFDGVEYDVVDAYAQGHRVTGWHITAHNQLVFDRALARIAHRNGLSVALKNDLGQVPKLRAAVRLRDQRAVLPVPRVHEQPGARLQGVHPRRQGGVPGRVPDPAEPFLRQGGRPRDQLDQEGRRLLAAGEALEALRVGARGSACPDS